MNEAEIRKALEAGARCDFHYTSTGGEPVLAIRMQSTRTALDGVVKLNGHLVKLTPASDAVS